MSEYIKGLVSVVIPTYKRSDLLKKAIDTVLAQTYQDLELLVVNDNIRNDEYSLKLYELISTYTDPRLKLVEQEKHINGAAARNAGIREAKGEYIAFQDDDDYWELQKLEHQVKLLSSLPKEYGAVSCLMRIYSNGKLIQACAPYRSGNILMDILDRKTSMGTGALLIRREALDEAGYFDENLMRHQDLQLFARIANKFKIQLEKVYLHNRENKDNQNRPTIDKLIAVKQAYFSSIKDILDSLSNRERRIVYIMHDFECAYAFIRGGRTGEGVKKMLRVFSSPTTIGLAFERTGRRIIEKKMRGYLNRKYSL
ncbi:MAG: glycosyltransferase family 2 protein [Lachnospira sp.]